MAATGLTNGQRRKRVVFFNFFPSRGYAKVSWMEERARLFGAARAFNEWSLLFSSLGFP